MRKIILLLILAPVIIIACQQKPKVITADTEAEKAAVSALFDKFNSALISKDVNTMIALITDNSLSCGTDPSEFFDKTQVSDVWKKSFADTITYKYSIDRREIRVASDGNSALIVEQYIIPSISSRIHLRNVCHAVKMNDKWMIDFLSWNMVLKNEDLPKLIKALE